MVFRRFGRNAFIGFLIALFTLAQIVVSVHSYAADRMKVNPDEALTAAVSNCKSAEQLDCIESVTILTADGKRLRASQTKEPSDFEIDQSKQRVEEGASTWEYLDSSGAKNFFVIDGTLVTPKFIVAGSVDDVDVPKAGEEGSESETETEEEKPVDTEKVSVDTRFYEPKLTITALFGKSNSLPQSKKLNQGEKLEVVVRLSWLSVEEVYLSGKDSSIFVDGKKIILTGSEVQIYERQSSRNRLTGQVTYSTIARDEFEFTVIHPKPSSEKPNCYESGYKLTSSNASSLAMSEENSSNSLKFTASSYSYKTDNSLVDGFAIIKVPLAWLTCRFPSSDLKYANSLTVQVSTTDGSKIAQNPTSKASIVNGVMDVRIENFRFAKTEILIKADESQISAAKSKEVADKAAEESRARAEAEAKVKAEAEAKAKAEAEAKAKAEAEAKAAAEAAAAKAKADADAAASAVKKKVTITCIKGKTTKKVTSADPKCPKGFKKK